MLTLCHLYLTSAVRSCAGIPGTLSRTRALWRAFSVLPLTRTHCGGNVCRWFVFAPARNSVEPERRLPELARLSGLDWSWWKPKTFCWRARAVREPVEVHLPVPVNGNGATTFSSHCRVWGTKSHAASSHAGFADCLQLPHLSTHLLPVAPGAARHEKTLARALATANTHTDAIYAQHTRPEGVRKELGPVLSTAVSRGKWYIKRRACHFHCVFQWLLCSIGHVWRYCTIASTCEEWKRLLFCARRCSEVISADKRTNAWHVCLKSFVQPQILFWLNTKTLET